MCKYYKTTLFEGCHHVVEASQLHRSQRVRFAECADHAEKRRAASLKAALEEPHLYRLQAPPRLPRPASFADWFVEGGPSTVTQPPPRDERGNPVFFDSRAVSPVCEIVDHDVPHVPGTPVKHGILPAIHDIRDTRIICPNCVAWFYQMGEAWDAVKREIAVSSTQARSTHMKPHMKVSDEDLARMADLRDAAFAPTNPANVFARQDHHVFEQFQALLALRMAEHQPPPIWATFCGQDGQQDPSRYKTSWVLVDVRTTALFGRSLFTTKPEPVGGAPTGNFF